jgi:hypothetical protein
MAKCEVCGKACEKTSEAEVDMEEGPAFFECCEDCYRVYEDCDIEEFEERLLKSGAIYKRMNEEANHDR